MYLMLTRTPLNAQWSYSIALGRLLNSVRQFIAQEVFNRAESLAETSIEFRLSLSAPFEQDQIGGPWGAYKSEYLLFEL